MYAVFAMECPFLKEKDDSVFLFDSREEAEQWVIDTLVSEGVVMVDGERYIVDGVTYGHAEDAIDAWYDGGSMFQFLHPYPVHDKRKQPV